MSNMKDLLQSIPAYTQRQDSVIDQLIDLQRVANKLGMYDATDAINQLFKLNKFDNLKYGCHCDLEDDMKPDNCVIDSNNFDNCVHAHPGMRKEQCKYWRIIKNE